ncbi:unnamed protein product [Trichogramma brassicae]|uniref:HMG box domain-containing protein n=1 Tax=Trichogramma brassicae TaxID=86971 RepID=A0A6H5HXA6_9HYME|nr:unnamed protein product [Trichogramma brassicae]
MIVAEKKRERDDEQSMPASRFLYLHRAIRKKKTGGFENERHHHHLLAIGSSNDKENDQPIDLHRSATSKSIGEKDDNKHELRRRLVHIEPKHQHQQQQPLDLNIDNVGGIKEEKIGGNSDREQSSSPEQGKIVLVNKPKIPRPANAFMLFANEWRKKLAVQNPRESNKDISGWQGVGAARPRRQPSAAGRRGIIVRDIDVQQQQQQRYRHEQQQQPKAPRRACKLARWLQPDDRRAAPSCAAAAAAAAAAETGMRPLFLTHPLTAKHTQANCSNGVFPQ